MNGDGLIIGCFLFLLGLILFPIGLQEVKENIKEVNELSLWRKIVIYAIELWSISSLTSVLAWILGLSLILLFAGLVFIGFSLSIFE